MSQRSDALKALRGEVPEHIPFLGRMDLWYNYNWSGGTLPAPYENASLWDIQRDLGIGILGFGRFAPSLFRSEYVGRVEAQTWWEDGEQIEQVETPYGCLRRRFVLSSEFKGADVTPACIEYFFKSPDDYDALQYLFEHTRVVDNHEEYGQYLARIGEDGVGLPFTGCVPMHSLMKEYIGYNRCYFELYDHLPRLERLTAAVTALHLEILRIAAASPAQVIEVGGNYDQVMTPPPVFRKYFLPFYQQVVPLLHAAGKIVAIHGDGDMRPELLSLMRETGVDAVEALTPRPMTSIDLRKARSLWQDQLTLWGGIPAILLSPTCDDTNLAAWLEDLFAAVAPGNRFILGFGDNVPTDGLWSRILQVVDSYRQHCRYPISNAASVL